MKRGTGIILAAAVAAAVALSATALDAGGPGYPDHVTWSGMSWQVVTSKTAVYPGPNVFAKANVSVDGSGFLHLRIARDLKNRWASSEIIGPTRCGYGTYTFVTATPLNGFDPNVVLGLFTWSDKARDAHREIDVEIARWGSATDSTNSQVVVQPHNATGHVHRFTASGAVRTRHRFTWSAGRVTFVSTSLDTGATIASYTYTGADVPKPGDERVHLNFWLYAGAPPTNWLPAEVIVESFTFAASTRE